MKSSSGETLRSVPVEKKLAPAVSIPTDAKTGADAPVQPVFFTV